MTTVCECARAHCLQTYCVDAQVADSACSATAYLGGVKANIATIGVSARVPHGACAAARDPAHHVHSIAEWALSDGRDAGTRPLLYYCIVYSIALRYCHSFTCNFTR